VLLTEIISLQELGYSGAACYGCGNGAIHFVRGSFLGKGVSPGMRKKSLYAMMVVINLIWQLLLHLPPHEQPKYC
jgi:hypothetical protein